MYKTYTEVVRTALLGLLAMAINKGDFQQAFGTDISR